MACLNVLVLTPMFRYEHLKTDSIRTILVLERERPLEMQIVVLLNVGNFDQRTVGFDMRTGLLKKYYSWLLQYFPVLDYRLSSQ